MLKNAGLVASGLGGFERRSEGRIEWQKVAKNGVLTQVSV